MLPKLVYYPVYFLFLVLEFILEKLGRKILIKGRPGTPDSEDIYLVRYYLLNNTTSWNLYLHRFLRSDHDVEHDHPFDFVGLVLKGGYKESYLSPDRYTVDGALDTHFSSNPPGSFLIRQATHIHKVLIDRVYSWEERKKAPFTVILRSPRYQMWGFWPVEDGMGPDYRYWVPFDEYLGVNEEDVLPEAK